MDRVRVSVDEVTRQGHLDSISSAIRNADASRSRRPRFFAVAVALILLLPVIALASERSVPGDFLYPVKRAVEPIASVFDNDVAAVNRVEEVETLYERDAPSDVIHEQVDRARDAVTDHHPDLSDRIDRVVVDLRRRDLGSHDEPHPLKDDDGGTDRDHQEDRRSTGDSENDGGRRGSSTTTVDESDTTSDRGGDG